MKTEAKMNKWGWGQLLQEKPHTLAQFLDLGQFLGLENIDWRVWVSRRKVLALEQQENGGDSLLSYRGTYDHSLREQLYKGRETSRLFKVDGHRI